MTSVIPGVPTFVERKEKKVKMMRVHKLTPAEEIKAHKERFYQEILVLAQKLRVEKKFIAQYLWFAGYRLKQDGHHVGNRIKSDDEPLKNV